MAKGKQPHLIRNWYGALLPQWLSIIVISHTRTSIIYAWKESWHTTPCTYMHTVVTMITPRSLQLYQVFLPAILGKISTVTRCLSTTYVYHQRAHESIKRPVHDLLRPPGVQSSPPAQAHNGMDVAVVKLDQLINWGRKVNNLVQGSMNCESSALRMYGNTLWQETRTQHIHRLWPLSCLQ